MRKKEKTDIEMLEVLMQEVEKNNKLIEELLNTQPQTEENEPEKVYVEPYESANPEGAIKVEWKSRDEIADNLQAQFEYGRHGTYKDLESARKVFDKERVKEWDRTAMETYKQATQDTPEEWEKELRNLKDEQRIRQEQLDKDIELINGIIRISDFSAPQPWFDGLRSARKTIKEQYLN